MGRIIFIGDVHNNGSSIVNNYARFLKRNKKGLSDSFALLLEEAFDGTPEEGSAQSAIQVITKSKPSNDDKSFLYQLASKSSVIYTFDTNKSKSTTYSLARQEDQYENILKLVKKIRKTYGSMDILIIVGAAHLETSDDHPAWMPHHEQLDGVFKNDVFCYSTYTDNTELNYDDV